MATPNHRQKEREKNIRPAICLYNITRPTTEPFFFVLLPSHNRPHTRLELGQILLQQSQDVSIPREPVTELSRLGRSNTTEASSVRHVSAITATELPSGSPGKGGMIPSTSSSAELGHEAELAEVHVNVVANHGYVVVAQVGLLAALCLDPDAQTGHVVQHLADAVKLGDRLGRTTHGLQRLDKVGQAPQVLLVRRLDDVAEEDDDGCKRDVYDIPVFVRVSC